MACERATPKIMVEMNGIFSAATLKLEALEFEIGNGSEDNQYQA